MRDDALITLVDLKVGWPDDRPVIWCPCGAEIPATKSNFLTHLNEVAQGHLDAGHLPLVYGGSDE